MSIAVRASTAVLLAVFCFQLSRFYVSVDACQHHKKDGNVLQHCQDLPGWLSAHQVQLGTGSAPVAEPALEPIRLTAYTPADPMHDTPLPPPFHPPRRLS